jgi:hypothetical protein
MGGTVSGEGFGEWPQHSAASCGQEEAECEEGRQGAKRTLEGAIQAPSKPGAGDKPAT